MKHPAFFLFLCLFMQVCVISINAYDISVEFPDQYVKVETSHTFNAYVYNFSDGSKLVNGISCNIAIHGKSGELMANEYDELSGDSGNYEFLTDAYNFSEIGEYEFVTGCNSSDNGGYESGIITANQSGNLEIMLAYLILIIFIPFAIGLFCLVAAFLLGEEHDVMRIFLQLLGLGSVLMMFWFFNTILSSSFGELPAVSEDLAYGVWIYSCVYFVIIIYWLLYSIKKMFQNMAGEDEGING